MGKFLRSVSDGSLRCRYCGDSECNCMEDGITSINFITIWRYGDNGTSVLLQPARQTLPNGKKIPSGLKIWIPLGEVYGIDEYLKKAGINNDFLNKLRFD